MELFTEQVLIAVSTPIYIVLIAAELLFSYWQHRHYYTVKDTLTNVYLSSLNMGLDILLRGFALYLLSSFIPYQFLQIEQVLLYWLVLFLFEDLMYYCLHYVDHYCRLFWAVHVTHHSSEHFNLTTGFRSSVFQPLYRFVYFIPLVLMGFAPLDIMLMYAITQIYGILIHTSTVKKLGVLEYFLVTPSHHRVHHASNVEYLDKNMGMCLIIWDKLFGTFQEEREDIEICYGLTYPLEDRGPINIIFHEWKKIWQDLQRPISWRHKWGYLFNPPGWSHDGSSKTSEQLRLEQESEVLQQSEMVSS